MVSSSGVVKSWGWGWLELTMAGISDFDTSYCNNLGR